MAEMNSELVLRSAFEVVTTRHGQMIVNPLDMYVGRALDKYGEYSEQEVHTIVSLVPVHGLAIDIGANLGAITLPLAKKVGPEGTVIAIEPQRLIYNALCGTMVLNGQFNTHCILAAMGSKSGTIKVPTLHPQQYLNFGGVSLEENAEDGEDRTLYRLDDICGYQRLDLIKIDVEGMEQDVLEGGYGTILKFRPILYVENDRPHKAEDLQAHIKWLGYAFTWHCPPLYNPDNFNKVAENIFPKLHAQNILCVPEERMKEFEARGVKEWV